MVRYQSSVFSNFGIFFCLIYVFFSVFFYYLNLDNNAVPVNDLRKFML